MIVTEAMSIPFGIVFLLFLKDEHVVSLSLCDVGKYLEVEEGREDNTFTCTGVPGDQTVTWYFSVYGDYAIASCQPSPSPCTVNDEALKTLFRVSRPSTTSSAITLNATIVPNLDYFGKSNLTCQTSPQVKVQCLLDYVYPADDITCTIAFDGDTWSVVTWCAVTKVRSIRGNYYCFLYQQSESSQVSTRVGSYTMKVEPSSSSGYYSGRCNMMSYLPSEGRYNYSVSIMPGEVNVPATFSGSNAISPPKTTPTHNCPSYVREGDGVNCECFVTEYGSPPGKLTWNSTSSNVLSLAAVTMNQHGVSYVCSLAWNNTVLRSVTYTLLVAYPPTRMSLKLNSGDDIVTVEEKTHVNISCQSDGRPTPSLTITDLTNGVLESLPGENATLADKSVNIRHGLVETRCEDSGEYRCAASNSVGSKYLTVRLLVRCAPRRDSADGSFLYPIIEKGDSATFELVTYPTSVNVTKYYLGLYFNSSKVPASDGVFGVVCTASSQYIYKITCTVNVISVTPETAGFYQVSVSNELGSVTFVFQTLARNTTKSDQNEDVTSAEFSRGIGVGLGVGLCIAAGEAVGFVFFWQRKRRTLRAKGREPYVAYSSQRNISFEKGEELNSPSPRQDSDGYAAVGTSNSGRMPTYLNNTGGDTSSHKTSDKPSKVYDALCLQEVGVSSPYTSLTEPKIP